MEGNTFICDQVWIEKNIDIAWTLVSYSRKGLGVPVSPTIGTSFIYLHNFYKNNTTTSHPLYMMLVSSLFLACKTTELYRSIDMIFSEFAKTTIAFTSHVPEKIVFGILGGNRDFHNTSMTEEEKESLFSIEVELLDASNWYFTFPLPFDHMSMHGNIFQDLPLTDQEINLIGQNIIRVISMMMKCPRIVNLDCEIVAAAVIENETQPILNAKGIDFCPTIREWLNYAKSKDNTEYSNVIKYITLKMKRFYNSQQQQQLKQTSNN